MPELRQLRVLMMVGDELNFTRAAARLFMTQQAVSKVIRQLESELEVDLIERSTHTVRLTAAGESLVRDAQQILLLVDSAVGRAHEISSGRAGTVRVGISPALGPGERDAVVRALRTGAASLSVALSELRPEKAVAELQSRKIDLAVLRTAPDLVSIDSAELTSTPARLYVPVEHRLAGRTDAVRLDELDGERLMTWNPPGTPFTDLMVKRLAEAGAGVHPIMASTTGMGSALSDLPDLDAIAIAPGGWQNTGQVVELYLAEHFNLPLVVIWASGALSSAVKRVRTALGAT